jgi:thiamine-phosphate pyrophosphorylase
MAVVSSADAGLRAVERGASILQLRAPGLTGRELEAEARMLVAASAVPVLVSGRVDIAIASRAAGVNLPEAGIGVEDARRLLGDAIIGRSVHSIDGARQAESAGADYVIFGPVWASATHEDAPPRGLLAVSEVVRAVSIPVIAIGGVDQERAGECVAAGAAGYAAIRMFA